MGRLYVFQAQVADGYYVVTRDGERWQWRGTAEGDPFATRKLAKFAASNSGIPEPWWVGRATAGVITAAEPR